MKQHRGHFEVKIDCTQPGDEVILIAELDGVQIAKAVMQNPEVDEPIMNFELSWRRPMPLHKAELFRTSPQTITLPIDTMVPVAEATHKLFTLVSNVLQRYAVDYFQLPTAH